MIKLTKDTPEWHKEWNNSVRLLEAWKLAPDNDQLTAAIRASLERLGIIVNADHSNRG